MVEQVIAAFLVVAGLVAPVEGVASSNGRMMIQEEQVAATILQEVARDGVEKIHEGDNGSRGDFDLIQRFL